GGGVGGRGLGVGGGERGGGVAQRDGAAAGAGVHERRRAERAAGAYVERRAVGAGERKRIGDGERLAGGNRDRARADDEGFQLIGRDLDVLRAVVGVEQLGAGQRAGGGQIGERRVGHGLMS